MAVEPHAKKMPKSLASCKNVKLVKLAGALKAADVVVLLVDHDEFKAISKKALFGKACIDTRGVWSGVKS